MPACSSGRDALSLCLLLAFAAPPGRAADSPIASFSNESLRHLQVVDDPQLSPDGMRVLLEVREPTAEGGEPHLWITDVRGGFPQQLTFSPDKSSGGEYAGQWSADSQTAFFLAKKGEHAALFTLSMAGGERREVKIAFPHLPERGSAGAELLPDIEGYRISPDGRWLALIAHDSESADEKLRREAKNDAHWVDHDKRRSRVFLLAIGTGEISPIKVPGNALRVTWSHDSSRLLIVAEGDNHASDLADARTVWRLNTSAPQLVEQLKTLPSSVDLIAESAQGQALVYLSQAAGGAPTLYNDLYLADMNGVSVRNLSAGSSGTVFNGAVGVHFGIAAEPIPLKDGSIVQQVQSGLDIGVAVIAPLQSATKELKLPMATTLRVRTNANQNGWLFLGSSADKLPMLLYAKTLWGQRRALNIPTAGPMPDPKFTVKRLQWQNEGLAIDGLLYLPNDSVSRAVPLVVEAHGGPTFAFADEFESFPNFLLTHGWAVLRVNPRGSSGRGVAFAAANRNDLGGADLRDILAGVDVAAKNAPIDTTRLALVGYSYGGEIAAFAEGQTSRFKGIVSGAPVIDQYSEYGTEEDSSGDRWFFGRPWEHPSDAWRQSPLARVGESRTPFLLLQGEADEADPVGQSQEMYRALRQVGVPVDLVTYPREDHLSLMLAIYGYPTKEPWHGFDARARIESFITKAFGNAD